MRRFFSVMQDNIPNDNDFRTIQNVREDIIGELEAVIQYSNHIRQTNSLATQVTTQSILEEEQIHIGELMALLFKLDPSSKTQFDKGVAEFNDRLARNT